MCFIADTWNFVLETTPSPDDYFIDPDCPSEAYTNSRCPPSINIQRISSEFLSDRQSWLGRASIEHDFFEDLDYPRRQIDISYHLLQLPVLLDHCRIANSAR